jgi:Uri superfamily endonuclease
VNRDPSAGSHLADIQVLPPDPGTYALLLRPSGDVVLTAGKLGSSRLNAGLYVYVGSAEGSGGVRARVAHHLRYSQHIHWHIDSLTQQTKPDAVCWVLGSERLECSWVQFLLMLPGAFVPVPGFGSSDCHQGCLAHLVKLPSDYGPSEVAGALDSIVTRRLPVSWRKVAP